MTDRFDNDHTRHPAWIVERRACPLCCVKSCGCPSEPEPTIGKHITLGEE